MNANNTFLTGSVANPFAGLLPGNSFNNPTIARSQLLRPYPQFGDIRTTNNDGKSWYSCGEVSLQKRFSQGLHAGTLLHLLELEAGDGVPERRRRHTHQDDLGPRRAAPAVEERHRSSCPSGRAGGSCPMRGRRNGSRRRLAVRRRRPVGARRRRRAERTRGAEPGRRRGRGRRLRPARVPGRLRRRRGAGVPGRARGAAQAAVRRVPGLRALRARAPRRLRVGERPRRVPLLRPGPRDVRGGAADEQRPRRVEQADGPARRSTTGTCRTTTTATTARAATSTPPAGRGAAAAAG